MTTPPLPTLRNLLRLLRPRLVLALAAAAAAAAFVVLAVLAPRGATQTAGPHGAATTAASGPASASASPSPSSSDRDDDGASDNGPQAATVTAGPGDPREAAVEFLTKYLNTLGKSPQQWRDSFADLVTPTLAQLLADTDPSRVPAGRVGDQISTAPAGDALVVVSVPIVANSDRTRVVTTVKLTLTGASHRWLVSEVDEAS